VIIASDIGNTNIVVGFIDNGAVKKVFRIATDRGRTSDEYKLLISIFMEEESIKKSSVEDFIVSSVVPPLIPIFKSVSKKLIGKEAFVITPQVDLGFSLCVEEPQLVGTDRLCDVAAGREVFPGENVCVVDFGTATAFNIITKDSCFIGGPISVGIIAAANALFVKTAKLPRIMLSKPKSAIGKDTVTEMQSGIVLGLSGMVDRLVEEIEKEINGKVRVIATGGISHVMKGVSKRIEIFDKELTLKGMYAIYKSQNRRN
jgi:type III pantothenate kinase